MTAIVTKQTLQQMLDSADEAKRARIVGRALVVLFDRQTEDEKASNDTKKHNTIGFAASDAKSGSLTAKYFIKHGTLLQWQVDRWLKKQPDGHARICRYVRQLNEIAEQKARSAQCN